MRLLILLKHAMFDCATVGIHIIRQSLQKQLSILHLITTSNYIDILLYILYISGIHLTWHTLIKNFSSFFLNEWLDNFVIAIFFANFPVGKHLIRFLVMEFMLLHFVVFNKIIVNFDLILKGLQYILWRKWISIMI